MNSIIFHVDVNSAFLSWEAAYRIHHLGAALDIRSIPSVVSGNKELRHGIILAKSIPAKKFGIQTGEPIQSALKKCPDLYTVPPHYNLYQKCSISFINLLKEYSPVIEQYSIDEAFIDVTPIITHYDNPFTLANIIRERIHRELGFTVNIGVSSNKILAKMASDFQKPNRIHSLFPDEIQEKMWPLPVSDLFFVGRATLKKMPLLGIYTIGDLAKMNPTILRQHLKKHGEVIWHFANGIDTSPVIASHPANKGYGNSTTIAFDVTDRATAKEVLLALCETVGTRLRKHQVKIEVISIGIKSYDLHYQSHQITLPSATNITKEIYQYTCQLFDELWDGTPIRHLGVHTNRVKDQDFMRQFHLFDHTDYTRYETLDQTIDAIRQRFGKDAIKRATFIDTPIDHLSGGISRDRQSVDYSTLEII
ncbi:MAG: DNA polymerase IV [Eubacteriales bacterium]